MRKYNRSSLLEKIISRIKKRGVIILDDILDLVETYGEDVLRAVDALEYGRAYRLDFNHKYKVNIFVGNHDYYIIIPKNYYCGCMSKYATSLLKRELCYHLIAYMFLDALKKVKVISFDEKDFFNIIDELKYKKAT